MVDRENVRGRLAVDGASFPFAGCFADVVLFDGDILLLFVLLIAYSKMSATCKERNFFSFRGIRLCWSSPAVLDQRCAANEILDARQETQ